MENNKNEIKRSIPRAPRPVGNIANTEKVNNPSAARPAPAPIIDSAKKQSAVAPAMQKSVDPARNTQPAVKANAPAKSKPAASATSVSQPPARSSAPAPVKKQTAAPGVQRVPSVKQTTPPAPQKATSPVTKQATAPNIQKDPAPSAKQTAARPAQKPVSNAPQRPVDANRTASAPKAANTPANAGKRSSIPPSTPEGQLVRNIYKPEPERIVSHENRMSRETVDPNGFKPRRRKGPNPLKYVGIALGYMFTFVALLLITVLISLKLICGTTSPAAKELLVTTLLETGQMKDIASWFLSPEEIQQIVDGNTMSSFEEDIDSSLITIDKTDTSTGDTSQADIEIVEISGRTYFGTLMIVKDPSRVELASIYPWKAEGVSLDQLVNDAGAVAGINGGLYNSANNSGGRPYGVVVCKGELQLNEPNQFPGLVLIGFTEDNILEIIPLEGMTKQNVIDLVAEKKIRDAVTFQEEASDKNNHFVQLVINGEARDMNGMGSGLNPRTAIGQRADGSVLMLVTDGRGKAGHLGASASDLIDVMVEYGAVNAANLDGGSSSCMYYEGEYLMTSVTFYYSNSSWKLPLGFIVK